MLGPVGIHKLFHPLYQLSFVIGQLHIYEVNNDNTTKISQPQLSCNLFSSFKVCFERILFLVIAYTFITTVDIDDMKGFRMFNDQVCPAFQVDCFSKRRFYLFGNTK